MSWKSVYICFVFVSEKALLNHTQFDVTSTSVENRFFVGSTFHVRRRFLGSKVDAARWEVDFNIDGSLCYCAGDSGLRKRLHSWWVDLTAGRSTSQIFRLLNKNRRLSENRRHKQQVDLPVDKSTPETLTKKNNTNRAKHEPNTSQTRWKQH
jgi:hypothetical protein